MFCVHVYKVHVHICVYSHTYITCTAPSQQRPTTATATATAFTAHICTRQSATYACNRLPPRFSHTDTRISLSVPFCWNSCTKRGCNNLRRRWSAGKWNEFSDKCFGECFGCVDVTDSESESESSATAGATECG
jgi:hypothetical protein